MLDVSLLSNIFEKDRQRSQPCGTLTKREHRENINDFHCFGTHVYHFKGLQHRAPFTLRMT